MKKILSLVLTLTMVFTLAACSQDPTPQTELGGNPNGKRGLGR